MLIDPLSFMTWAALTAAPLDATSETAELDASARGAIVQAADAQEPSTYPKSPPPLLPYTFVEARWVFASLDGWSEDPDGPELDVSFALGDTWFLFGSYSDLDASAAGFDLERKAWSAGVGLHSSVTESVDLVLSARWTEIQVDNGAALEVDDQGYGIQGGFRFALQGRGEVGAGLLYTDLEEAGDDMALYLDAAYYFERRVGLTASYVTTGDVDTLAFGLRFVP